MIDIPYTKTLTPKTKAITYILILLLIGLLIGLILSSISFEYAKKRGKNFEERTTQILAKWYALNTVIICMNISLLLGLLIIYVDTFQKTHSSFMLGLLIFISVLLIQTILSLPIIHAALGEPIRLSGTLPNFFELLALTILLYLSME
ncbi:MAG: hypothetical protein QXX20_02830 [Candidatus Thermoplasmatota archaeon]